MKFTEEKLERAFLKLLGKQNFPHYTGNAIVRATDKVLIEADLQQIWRRFAAEILAWRICTAYN